MAINYANSNGNLDDLASTQSAVTKTTYGSGDRAIHTYIIKDTLSVSGKLIDNLSDKLVIFEGDSVTGMLQVADGGEVSFTGSEVKGGYDLTAQQCGLFFALNTASSWNRAELRLAGTGKLTIKKCLIRGAISPWFEPRGTGSVLLEDCIIDKKGANGADIQTNITGVKENVTFRRVKHYPDGATGVTIRDWGADNSSVAHLVANEIYHANDAWNNESATPLLIDGLTPNVGNAVEISQWRSRKTTIVNPEFGLDFIWGGHRPNSTANQGSVEVVADWTPTFTDVSGAIVENVNYAMTDNPVVATTNNLEFDGKPANEARLYAGVYDSANPTTHKVLIGQGERLTGGVNVVANSNDNRVRPRGVNTLATHTKDTDTNDCIYEFTVRKAGYVFATPRVTLKETPAHNVNLREDENYSNTDANLTTVSTIQELYDFCKQAEAEDFDLPADIVTITGNTLTVKTGYTIVLDANLSKAVEVTATEVKFKASSGGINASGGINTISGSVTSLGASDLSYLKANGKVSARLNIDAPSGVTEQVWGVWLRSQGELDRTGMVSAVGNGVIELDPNTDYFFVADAINARRTSPVSFNSGSLGVSLEVALIRIAKSTGENLLPDTLTTDQQVIANEIIYNATTHAVDIKLPSDYATTNRWDDTNKIYTFTADDFIPIAYKCERIQSGQASLRNPNTIFIDNFRFILGPSNIITFSQHADNADCTVNLCAFQIVRTGDTEHKSTFLHHENGTLLANTGVPIIAQVDGGFSPDDGLLLVGVKNALLDK